MNARRALALALVVALLSTTTASGTSPQSAEVAFLVSKLGGTPSDWLVTSESLGPDPVSGDTIRVAKYLNAKTDEIRGVVSGANGEVRFDDLDARRAQALAGLAPFERKADRALRHAIDDAEGGLVAHDTVPVGIFVEADVQPAIDAVYASNPQVERQGNTPVPNSSEQAESIKAQLRQAHARVYLEAEGRVARMIENLGGHVVYRSTAAPLLFVELPVGTVEAVANIAEITDLGLEGGWHQAMNVAGATVQADWTSDTNPGDQGTGVKVGVIEYRSVHNTGDLAGRVIGYYNAKDNTTTPCYSTDGTDHPTWVAGAIASQNSTYRGIAPGALILSAATCWPTNQSSYYDENDHDVVEAADWAIAQGADVLNLSLVQDTSTGLETARKYFDSVVDEQFTTVVAAAGNLDDCGTGTATTGEYVGSPGVGWNVVTVGGADDKGTTSHSDDRLWYQPSLNKGACWVDPVSTWNTQPDPDFNKPELSAPSVAVRTANGLEDDGTSVASPIVAGIAAQLIARSAIADADPNLVKALVMAGAIWGAPLPSGTWSTDHQGVGIASAKWANNALIYEGGSTGGFHTGQFNCVCVYTKSFSVSSGQYLQIATVWNSQTSGSSKWSKTDNLDADLDMVVTLPDGTKLVSDTSRNAWEYVDFVANQSGTVTVKVNVYSLNIGIQGFALAWIKSTTP